MKPSIPKGTRDFSPSEMLKRNFIFSSIRSVFERYGFRQIETPAMENLETLLGKYGDEGDKLLFKVLNSGEKLKVTGSDYKLSDLSEKGLRYDLTVPFARYVVQHQNDIHFPFRRYQIQPVWRGDRPQKGRYREFYQCDVDVIGSDALISEVDLISIIEDVFTKMKLKVLVKMNNRKILNGISEVIGEKDKIIHITVALDKLDKIGVDGVNKELNEKGVSKDAIAQLQPLIAFNGNTEEKLELLKQLLAASEIGMKGIQEIEEVFSLLKEVSFSSTSVELDITLARGLHYYTGTILEVKSQELQFGSICGGGRYDDLTGIFGLPNVSGVGISFGIDRIYDVMEELKRFDDIGLSPSTTRVLFAHFGKEEQAFCLSIASQLRKLGFNCEIYPDVTKKIVKQFEYANKLQIPFVIVVGAEEMKSGTLSLKDLRSGKQENLSIGEIILKLSS